MRIGNKNTVHSYFINDFELPIHTPFNDLGITFNENMSFNTHINTICTKAHLIINRLFRCFITNDTCLKPIRSPYCGIGFICLESRQFNMKF